MGAYGVWTCSLCGVVYEETEGHECTAADLAARVAELESENAKLREAVRWEFNDLFAGAGNFQSPLETRVALGEFLDAWLVAHPIVREVVERGEE